MKKALVLIFLFLSFQSFSETGEKAKENSVVESFEIIVIDADTQEPIPAAQIKIDQNDLEAYTDFDGLAEIKNITSGNYDISISLVSYKKIQFKSFQLNQTNRQLIVKLQS